MSTPMSVPGSVSPGASGDMSGRTPPTVAGKVMRILEAFVPGDVRLTLTEICRRADLPLATGHRLIAELVAGGFLDRLPDASYRVGTRLWQIGTQAAWPRELRELALPYMLDLYAETRENIQLAVLHEGRAMYIERLRGPKSVPVLTRVAAELPLHATGVGKVLLAFCPPDLAEELLSRPLTSHAPNTITDPDRLRADLAEIRRTGLAYTNEEMSIGTCSVAAPVYGPGEEVVAALSVVAWRHSSDVKRFGAAARSLSRAGHSADRPASVCGPGEGRRRPVGGGLAARSLSPDQESADLLVPSFR